MIIAKETDPACAFGGNEVGVDLRNDIAVLKVDAPAELLTPVELGDSANLQVGQRAIVIGNPFGQFGGTLTTGVISALDRTLQSRDGREITGIPGGTLQFIGDQLQSGQYG